MRGAKTILEMAKKTGFIYTSQQDEIVVLPPQYILIHLAGSEGVNGLRWMILGPKPKETILNRLQLLLEQEPSLCGGTHEQLVNHITKLP